jgi:site-specific DNA recombinase
MLDRAGGAAPARVAAYIRWSTDEQGQGTTLAVQRERVELFARSQGWELAGDLIFVDDGYSGGSLDRPAMNRLRQAVLEGRVDCVVVYRLDRLSRSLVDTVNLVRQEWQGRCMLHSATENFDTRSPVGQMVFNMLASFAEFERSLIRERTLSGKRKRAQEGRNAGQRYPYGYQKGPDGAWALDGLDEATGEPSGRAAVVRRIFRAYLAGEGMGAIARSLNGMGIQAPAGGRWAFATVGRILSNPIYAGEYRYGRRGGRNGGAGVAVPGAAPAIVTPEEYARAVRRRSERYAGREKMTAGEYLLTGLARCLRCGSPIAGSRGKTRRYYVCTGRTLRAACDCAYLDADALEGAVTAEVHRVVERYWSRIVGGAGGGGSADFADLAGSCRMAVARAEADLATLARRRRRLEDEFLAGGLGGQAYSRLAERLDWEEAEARERLSRAAAALEQASRMAAAVGTAGGGACAGMDADPWAHLALEERRQVLREFSASLRIYQAKHRPGSRHGNPNPIEVEWQMHT